MKNKKPSKVILDAKKHLPSNEEHARHEERMENFFATVAGNSGADRTKGPLLRTRGSITKDLEDLTETGRFGKTTRHGDGSAITDRVKEKLGNEHVEQVKCVVLPSNYCIDCDRNTFSHDPNKPPVIDTFFLVPGEEQLADAIGVPVLMPILSVMCNGCYKAAYDTMSEHQKAIKKEQVILLADETGKEISRHTLWLKERSMRIKTNIVSYIRNARLRGDTSIDFDPDKVKHA